jgi:hypothetical protein
VNPELIFKIADETKGFYLEEIVSNIVSTSREPVNNKILLKTWEKQKACPEA